MSVSRFIKQFGSETVGRAVDFGQRFSPARGCRRLVLGCFVVFILAGVLSCALLFLAIHSLEAAIQPQSVEEAKPLAVYLLIDNSNSMFEKEGIGSDPALLRIEAARLFISYLGVDDSDLTHACSVIFFGGEANIVVPMTPLSSDRRRAEIYALIAQPGRMRWTDHGLALALAHENIATVASAGRQPAIVLLTDGKPEWDDRPTAAEIEAYAARLRRQGTELGQAGIPLFIILLANEATDADPDIAAVWQPVWEEMVQSTPGGRFYTARQAEGLAGIYHDIVVAISGGQTDGPVVSDEVGPAGLRQDVEVEADLARLTLVIRKSQPELTVTILQPGGTPLSDAQPRVRHAGQPGVTGEEIWVVDDPVPGTWTVLADGQGRVIVWKDYRTKPAPMASPTPAPTATPTPAPTGTPRPTQVIVTPAPHRTAVPYSLPPEARATIAETKTFPWPWVVLAPLAAGLARVVYRQLHGRQPIVEGELHAVAGPGFADGQAVVELDSLNKASITIGPSPADIPLTGTDRCITLRPGPRLGDSQQMLVSGPPEALLDGRPLGPDQPLNDLATLTLGPNELQYQNLRLGSAIRAMLPQQEEMDI
jgi:hypothetical protein